MYDLSAEAASFAQSTMVDWSCLNGSTVFVTGATGLIGSSCIRLLLERNRAFNAQISVVALVRDLVKAKTIFKNYQSEDGLSYVISDLTSFNPDSIKPNFIIHAGCPTASNYFIEHPVETVHAIVDGTVNILECAHRSLTTSMVYVSSMEVYGNGRSTAGLNQLLTETDYGYIDPLNIRSCYPESKRMAELYCCAYAKEYAVPVKIARLSQTFGPGISKSDTRLFALIAKAALTGDELVLRTTGESTRMYTYIYDAVIALLVILTKGISSNAYNVANPETYSSVKSMAEQVLNTLGKEGARVRINIDPAAPFPPTHHLPLDVSKISNLGWNAEIDLIPMYERLMAYLEN